MKTNFKLVIGAFPIGFLLGGVLLYSGFRGLPIFFLLLLVILAVFGVTFFIVLFGERQAKTWRWGFFIFFVMLFSLAPLGAMIIRSKIIDYKIKAEANLVIEQIEEFKKENGFYPEDLRSFEWDQKLLELDYATDSSLISFEVSYWDGGLRYMIFDSREKKWILYDD